MSARDVYSVGHCRRRKVALQRLYAASLHDCAVVRAVCPHSGTDGGFYMDVDPVPALGYLTKQGDAQHHQLRRRVHASRLVYEALFKR